MKTIKTDCKGIEKQLKFLHFRIQDLYKNEYICDNKPLKAHADHLLSCMYTYLIPIVKLH